MTTRTRLIAVTGYGQAEDRSLALQSGFDRSHRQAAHPETLLRLIF